jgi:hypothetical protein
MGDSTINTLDEAAASVRAAWHELATIQGKDGSEETIAENDSDRRYIAARWRVQNAEENYQRVQDERFMA